MSQPAAQPTVQPPAQAPAQPASQPLYSPPLVFPLSRSPQAVPDACLTDPFAAVEAPAGEPFPAQALHACRVLAHLLQRVPRPESVQLFTADHWSAPWLQVHLYPDPDDAQLAAYQHALGGRLTRSRSDGESRTVVYSELATVVDRVRVQVWNVNESPLQPPLRPSFVVPGQPSNEADHAEKTDEAAAEPAEPLPPAEPALPAAGSTGATDPADATDPAQDLS
ncbi:hypothetical protein [Streptacidiphilus jiangxiensis]|uniref:Uncharacterized protein n=1 Tax=Streptacidiphilus jiangxiensis TaxID=235985 RepID=A0A1H7QMI7_STRJI|nr:hypothetical protein [Streptacidiphilus jiangxiensis]SEL48815.1 hypothetical protein SAMN05414137_10995 [Streptacidiphilus jiangxiensis]